MESLLPTWLFSTVLIFYFFWPAGSQTDVNRDSGRERRLGGGGGGGAWEGSTAPALLIKTERHQQAPSKASLLLKATQMRSSGLARGRKISGVATVYSHEFVMDVSLPHVPGLVSRVFTSPMLTQMLWSARITTVRRPWPCDTQRQRIHRGLSFRCQCFEVGAAFPVPCVELTSMLSWCGG